MYTLTEISTQDENVNYHYKLGDRFSVIERECSKTEFERAYNAFFGNPKEILPESEINEQVYCIVITDGGREILPLIKGNFYYVVTENGKTFKNLTFK